MRRLRLGIRSWIVNINSKSVFNKHDCFLRLQSTTLAEHHVSPFGEKKSNQKKIIYSESLSKRKKTLYDFLDKKTENPICLRYFVEEEKDKKKQDELEDKTETVQFPYNVKTTFKNKPTLDKSVTELFSNSVVNLTPSDNEKLKHKTWKEHIIEKSNSETESVEFECVVNDNIDDSIKFGTSDPNVPVSSVPCGGCGALLQCCDRSIPGFLPKEVFIGKSNNEQAELCQRCYFLKEYDVALGVNVSPSEYPKLIKQLEFKKALVILLVDLFDFPCSVWPKITDLIGVKPVIVVGNKVDLFIQENERFLLDLRKNFEVWLENQGIVMKNVKHIALISAKTGYGIEELINKMYKHWGFKGDVYLVGCTNAGKSTLFNTLIQSDYCKVKASKLLQKATISAWPGTTLNLLKFPIMAPVSKKLSVRVTRLMSERCERVAYEKMKQIQLDYKLQQTPLTGHVGRTFAEPEPNNPTIESFSNDMTIDEDKPKGIDPNDPDFSRTKWCFDTPGVIHHDQIINFLTTPELLLTLPKSMVIPRNFLLHSNTTLFIAGLARLDYVSGRNPIWFTVYASKELPVTIINLKDADDVYKSYLGTDMFRVPFGSEARLKKWPEMSSKEFTIVGKDRKEATADIVLSSAGWVALTPPMGCNCQIKAWTPGGRGIHLRMPPAIKTGHTFRGDRIRNTPAFKVVMKEVNFFDIHKDPSRML